MANLAWASGQAGSAAVSGALAEVTSDLVPYCLLAGLCVITLVALRLKPDIKPSSVEMSGKDARR